MGVNIDARHAALVSLGVVVVSGAHQRVADMHLAYGTVLSADAEDVRPVLGQAQGSGGQIPVALFEVDKILRVNQYL